MSIKSKLMAMFGMGRKTSGNDMAKAELAIAASQGRTKGDAVRLRSCRERGFGSERADGKWMSPFDRYLKAVQVLKHARDAAKHKNRVKAGYGPENKKAALKELDDDLKLGEQRLAERERPWTERGPS